MMKNISKYWVSPAIYILFALLAYVAVIPFLNFGGIIGQGDLLFHLNRIVGLKEGLNSGVIPYRSFNVLSSVGSAVNFFYPFVYMLGFATLFEMIKNPVTAYYFGHVLILFVTFVIAYRSMISFSNHNRKRALLFALLYGFGAYREYLAFDQSVLGELAAYTFLPLVFLGFYNVFWGNAKRWVPLAAGMSLIIYAHILSTILTVVVMAVLLLLGIIFRFVKLTKERLLGAGLAVVTTIILTINVWLPFIYQMRQTLITTTIKQRVIFIAGIGDNLIRSFNDMYPNIGLMGIVAILVGLSVWVTKQKSTGIAYWSIGTVLFLMGSSLIPWRNLPLNIQYTIQFPYRLFGIASLFLFAYLAIQLDEISGAAGKPKRSSIIVILLVGVIATVGVYSKNESIVSSCAKQHVLRENDLNHPKVFGSEVNFITYRDGIESLTSSRHDYIGMFDYAPVDAWKPANCDSIINHQVKFAGKGIESNNKFSLKRAQFTVVVPKSGTVDIPVFMYGNETVKLNGEEVKAMRTKRGTVGVRTVAGRQIITVSYATQKWIYWLWIISLAGWFALISMVIFKMISKWKTTSEKVMEN